MNPSKICSEIWADGGATGVATMLRPITITPTPRPPFIITVPGNNNQGSFHFDGSGIGWGGGGISGGSTSLEEQKRKAEEARKKAEEKKDCLLNANTSHSKCRVAAFEMRQELRNWCFVDFEIFSLRFANHFCLDNADISKELELERCKLGFDESQQICD